MLCCLSHQDDEDDDDAFRRNIPSLVDRNHTFLSSTATQLNFIGRMAGFTHEICYDEDPDFRYGKHDMLNYVGDDAWKPQEWDANVDATVAAIALKPSTKGVWNEIIVNNNHKNTNAQGNGNRNDLPVVQAIFYVANKQSRPMNWEAHLHARLLAKQMFGKGSHRNIPILAMQPWNEKELFTCPFPWGEEEEDTIEDY